MQWGGYFKSKRCFQILYIGIAHLLTHQIQFSYFSHQISQSHNSPNSTYTIPPIVNPTQTYYPSHSYIKIPLIHGYRLIHRLTSPISTLTAIITPQFHTLSNNSHISLILYHTIKYLSIPLIPMHTSILILTSYRSLKFNQNKSSIPTYMHIFTHLQNIKTT